MRRAHQKRVRSEHVRQQCHVLRMARCAVRRAATRRRAAIAAAVAHLAQRAVVENRRELGTVDEVGDDTPLAILAHVDAVFLPVRVRERLSPLARLLAKHRMERERVKVGVRRSAIRLVVDCCPHDEDIPVVRPRAMLVAGAGVRVRHVVERLVQLAASDVPAEGEERGDHARGDRVGVKPGDCDRHARALHVPHLLRHVDAERGVVGEDLIDRLVPGLHPLPEGDEEGLVILFDQGGREGRLGWRRRWGPASSTGQFVVARWLRDP